MNDGKKTYKADIIKQEVLEKLRKLGEKIYRDISRGEFPELNIPSRTTKNIVYDDKLRQYVLAGKMKERTTKNIRHLRPFAQLLWIASFSKKLIEAAKTSTLRDTYYVAIGEGIDFEDQDESDEMIMELESIIDSPREDFHIFPEERASIYGDLVIEYTVPGFRGKRVDLSSHPDGFAIGPALTTAEFVKCGAEVLFVIEKGAVFSRFVEEGADKKYKALLLHTAGQSPRNARKLIRRLHEELNLPVYVFSIDGEEPVLILKNGQIRHQRIRELFPSLSNHYSEIGESYGAQLLMVERAMLNGLESYTVLSNGQAVLGNVHYILRHPIHEPLLEVKLTGGFSVRATSSHSIMVFEDYSLRPKEAKMIRMNDLIPVCLEVPKGSKLESINLVSLVVEEAPELLEKIWYLGPEIKKIKIRYSEDKLLWRRVRRGAVPLAEMIKRGVVPKVGWVRYGKSEVKIPIVLRVSNELGRLLGYFSAEGSIEYNDTGVRLTFGKHERDYVEDACRCAEKVFGVRPSISEGPHFVNVHVYGSIIAKLFRDILRTGERADDKEVPWIIFNAPDSVKMNYLIGYLRGDRRIKCDKRGFQLQSSTTSRKLASDLVLLYRQLGVIACVEHREPGRPHLVRNTGQIIEPKRSYYIVSVRDKDSLRKLLPVLTDLLGEETARNVTTYKGRSRKSPYLRSVPATLILNAEQSFLSATKNNKSLNYIKRLLTKIKNGYKLPSSRVSLNILRDLLNLCDEQRFDYKLKFLANMLKNKIVLLPVREIKEVLSQDRYVYDIEVGGAHTFIGGVGGILLHNTDADPYGVHIASVLIHGSALSAHIKGINVPDAIWAGVWASDITRYKLPSMKLNDQDVKRLRELEQDPRYQNDPWRREIKEFWKIKRKAELEAFSRYGLDFIVKEFLPERLAELQKR